MRKNDERNPRPVRGLAEKGSQKQPCLKGVLGMFVAKAFSSWKFLGVLTNFCTANTNTGIECDHGVNTVSHKINCVDPNAEKEGCISASKPDAIIPSTGSAGCRSKTKSRTMNTLVNTLHKAKALYRVVLMCHLKSTAPVRHVGLSQDNLAKNFCHKETKDKLTQQQEFLMKQNKEIHLLCDQAYLSNNFDQSIADETWNSEGGRKLTVRMRYLLTEEGKDGFSLSDKAILRSGKPMSEIYGSYEFEPGELESFAPISYDPEEDNFILKE